MKQYKKHSTNNTKHSKYKYIYTKRLTHYKTHTHIHTNTYTHIHTLQNKLKQPQYKLKHPQYKLKHPQYKLKQPQYKIYPNEIVTI